MKPLSGVIVAALLTIAAQPVRAQFLNMTGTVAYARVNGQAAISVQTISNSRSPGSFSGSLVLQLWASSSLYTGGTLHGSKMVEIQIGQLQAGYHFSDVVVDGTFHAPPRGTYYTILVLAEWSGTGYETEDWFNFPPTKYAKWIRTGSATGITN